MGIKLVFNHACYLMLQVNFFWSSPCVQINYDLITRLQDNMLNQLVKFIKSPMVFYLIFLVIAHWDGAYYNCLAGKVSDG